VIRPGNLIKEEGIKIIKKYDGKFQVNV